MSHQPTASTSISYLFLVRLVGVTNYAAVGCALLVKIALSIIYNRNLRSCFIVNIQVFLGNADF